MLEAWIPLAEIRAPLLPHSTQFVLPETCSIAAIRAGLQPLPFKHCDAARVASTATPGSTAAWPSLLDSVTAVVTSSNTYSIASLNSSGLAAVKQLHDWYLPLSYPVTFYNALLSNSTFLCLTATRNTSSQIGSLAGAVSACIDPSSFDSMSSQLTVHVLSLVIDPQDRRTGVASRLLSAVIKALAIEFQTAVKRVSLSSTSAKVLISPMTLLPAHIKDVHVVLHVASDNSGAIKLYESRGLREVRRLRGYYRKRRDGGSGEAIEMRGVLAVE
ncbi:hypothetical protein ACM66B_006012 [Microbotryomycetes sp. NB124-2]